MNATKLVGVWGLVAALAASCVPPGDGPIRIGAAHPLAPGASSGGKCTREAEEIISGTLDLAGSGAYLVDFEVLSEALDPSVMGPTGDPLSGKSNADFVGKDLVLSYSSTPAAISLSAERLPIYLVLPQGDKANLLMNLITRRAGEALANKVEPGDFSGVRLAVTVELRGILASGVAVKTNQAVFPIRVFHSGFPGCAPVLAPDGGTSLDGGLLYIQDQMAPTGPCGNAGGQDGTPLGCCSDPAFSSTCSKGT